METIGTIHNLIDTLIFNLGYDLDFVNSGYLWEMIESNTGKSIRIISEDKTTDGVILFIRGARVFAWVNNSNLPKSDELKEAIDGIKQNTPENAKVYKLHGELFLEFKLNNEFYEFKQYEYNGKFYMSFCKGPGMDYLHIVQFHEIDKIDEEMLKEFVNDTIIKIKSAQTVFRG